MILPGAGPRRARFILPALYLLLAAYVWVDFTRTNRDGLANVGLFLVTAPVSLFGLFIDWIRGSQDFSLMPDSFGYLGNHAIYYGPAVLATAALLFLLGRKIDRRPG